MNSGAGQKRQRSHTPPGTANSWSEQERFRVQQVEAGPMDASREGADVAKLVQQQSAGNGSTAAWQQGGGAAGGTGAWASQDQRSQGILRQQQQQQQEGQRQQQEDIGTRHRWEQRHYRQLQLEQDKQRQQQLLSEAARHNEPRHQQLQQQLQHQQHERLSLQQQQPLLQQRQQQQRQEQEQLLLEQQRLHQQQRQHQLQQQRQQAQSFEHTTGSVATPGGGHHRHNPSPSPTRSQAQQPPEQMNAKKKEQQQRRRDAAESGKQELVALKAGHGVAVDHLNMLVSLVEEMTCKWERQLEDVGEGRWNDDMLAREGTQAMKAVRSAALAGPALPVGVIDWPGVASSLWRRHSVAWSPQLCQGLWKFVAYGDVTAAMNALPRAGETLSGAWTRQDLLYESDTDALAVNPLCISKREMTSKNPRWGRSRTSNVKKREWTQAEKARSEEPLRRAPMLMSGSIDLRHSPERPDQAGTQMDSKSSKNGDQLVPLCTLAALPTFIRSRKRPASLIARPRDPPSPRSAKAAAEAVEAEARVYEERQAMQLLLDQSAADSSASSKQAPKTNHSAGNAHPPSSAPLDQSGQTTGAVAPKPPEKKSRKKSGSAERAASEAAKQAEIWAAASDAAATAAAAAAAAGSPARRSPTPMDSSGVLSAPQGPVMDVASAATLGQGHHHHGRRAVSEAPTPPVPPTANLHTLQAAAGRVGGQGDVDSTPRHPSAQHRQSAACSSFPDHQQQRGYQHQHQQPAVPTVPTHQSHQGNISYMSMAATSHGNTAENANTAGPGVPRYPPSQNLPSTAGGVAGGGAGGSGMGAGLAAAARAVALSGGATASRTGMHVPPPAESKVGPFARGFAGMVKANSRQAKRG